MKVNQIKEVFRKAIRNEPLNEEEWKIYAQNLTNEQVKTELEKYRELIEEYDVIISDSKI